MTARTKLTGLAKLGDEDLRSFALGGSANEHRTVLVEPFLPEVPDIRDSFGDKSIGSSWVERFRAPPRARSTKPIRIDHAKRTVGSFGAKSDASMAALGKALKRLEISARPIDSAKKFSADVNPSDLRRIVELDEVGFIFPNRTHRARSSGT